ncbi:MAG: class II aldolase/adducin family protein [Rhodospirillales bacterium]|nr:class II aldolase/adducin family protein [Rhodospirillales bacterium]
MTTPERDPPRRRLLAIYRQAAAAGLIGGQSGNLSLRIEGGMLITPSGARAETCTEADLVAMALDGAVPPGAGRRPSSEAPMHAAIYAARPAAGAILHAHSDAATALACLNRGLPAFHYMVTRFGAAEIACAPYVTFGTPALAAACLAALGQARACLLANHGMIVHAADAEAVLADAILLETLARQYLLAAAAGTPRLLSPTEIAEAVERFKNYG